MIQHKSVLNSLDNVQKIFSVKAGYFTTQRYSKHYQLVCMCLIQFRPPNHLGIQYFFSKNEIKCNRTNHITCSLIKTILSLSLPPPPIWKKSRFIGCPLPPKFPPGRLPSSSWEQLTYLVGKRVGRPQNLDMSILKVVVEKAKGAPTCTTQQSVQKCAKMHLPKLQAEAAAATTTRSCCWLAGSAFRYSSFLDSDFEKKNFCRLASQNQNRPLYIYYLVKSSIYLYIHAIFFSKQTQNYCQLSL